MAANSRQSQFFAGISAANFQALRNQNAQVARMMNRPPSSDSPRPSSVGSSQSGRSSKGKSRHDICVGEEIKIAVDIAFEKFRLSEDQKELEFPSSLTSTERAYIHRLCHSLGLKSKSKGKGANRFLTVIKVDGSQTVRAAAVFNLVRNSRHQIHTLIQRFPVTNKERQELQPRTDRSQSGEVAKELSKTTTGRLNNGVPQVPPGRGSSDLESFRRVLPVFNMREEIVKTINENKVVLISGETGSGKTTQVPQMILDDSHANNKACRIFCTQPRRISALTVAERVAAERGEKIGQTVGYQIRLESRTSPKTLLTFCTNGVLLRTLMGGDHSLDTVTHVIVDEIHERDRFSDFLLIAVRDLLPRHRNLKVILMSAALNIQLFSSYFNNCPVISVPGKMFDVKEHFLEDVLKMTVYSNKEMEKYRREMSKIVSQQKHLDDWCVKKKSEDDDRASKEVKEENIDVDNTKTVELGQEKEELEPWLVKEMDQLLTGVWLSGKEDIFEQIFHLIMSEDVSVDYMHSETSATPLMIAAGRGFTNVVEQLLNLGASVHIRASNDWTAVDWAKKFEWSDIIELLEAHAAGTEQTPHLDEQLLVKQSTSLTPEDRELLNVYHHSFDDEKVDVDLIITLLRKIHTTSKDGAVLIFLPGYDEIVSLREKIYEDRTFADNTRVFTLHSTMQSTDQKKVFKSPPAGTRKIILSTNIAETSVTINDVVHVIDSGKVKEKSFDALTSSSMLKARWVSKASALQRRGRAGRCQPGICYHLFSRVRFDSMQQYQDPEILRYPLQELCLHTKLLAPVNSRIEDFLAKAPEPPAFLITRNAVHLLKQIDALDPFDELTELGHHLTDLPVEPRFGKMVLYSVVLKCLDPILTIACSLAYRDPFVLPAAPSQKRAAAMAKRKFSANTCSDHMCLLRVFQAWQRARTEGWERSFCEKNYVSAATMEMIVGMRTQLLGQLRASGFVRARGGGDIRDLNTNSENWAVVKAALTAGMYPNIMRVDRDRCQLTTVKETKVRFHQSSVMSPAPNMLGTHTHQKAVNQLPTDWLVYEEMTRAHRSAQVKTCTVVSPITIAVFAGPAKLPPDYIKDAESGGSHPGRGDGAMMADDSSDSDSEDKDENRRVPLRLDDWLSFKVDSEAGNLAMQLRLKWHSLFLRRMRSPSKPWSQVDENVIRAVIGVLTNEEQSLGLQQPAGIGQRPRPMSTESLMSGGGNSRRGSYDTEYSDDSGDSRQNTPKARTFKLASVTPPKKKDLARMVASKGSLEDKSETSSTRSGSGSASNSGSLRGSAASSPCSSPQPGSPSRWAAQDPGANTSHPSRYFVMKASSHKNLDVSQDTSLWATSVVNEKKLNKAFQDGKVVHLVFSVQGSGHFQGVAKMAGLANVDDKSDIKEFSGPGIGGAFLVDWTKRANLPFQQCHHLLNPWNENKRVQISRDGQEIEPTIGEQLVKLWDKLSAYQPRHHHHHHQPHGARRGNQMGPLSPHWAGQQGGAAWGAHGSAPASQSMAQHMSFNHPLYVHPMMHGHHQMAGGFPGGQSAVAGQKVSPVMILQRGQGHSPNSTHQGHQGGANFYQGKGQK